MSLVAPPALEGGGAVYELRWIEGSVSIPERIMDTVVFVLIDIDDFPQQGERWRPLCYREGETWRSDTLFHVSSVREISPGTYGLRVDWLDDYGEQRIEWSDIAQAEVPLHASLQLTRRREA